jgi:hypothetical protein
MVSVLCWDVKWAVEYFSAFGSFHAAVLSLEKVTSPMICEAIFVRYGVECDLHCALSIMEFSSGCGGQTTLRATLPVHIRIFLALLPFHSSRIILQHQALDE